MDEIKRRNTKRKIKGTGNKMNNIKKEVLLNNKKTIITIEKENIILSQEKGLFKKKIKNIEIIPIKEINIKQKKSDIDITYQNKNITLSCNNIFEASNIKRKINNIQNNTNIFKSTGKSIKKIASTLYNNKELIIKTVALIITLKSKYDEKK